jgi:CheY-like chemotaxis protein
MNILLADDDIDDCGFFITALEEMRQNTGLTVVHDGERLMQHLAEVTNDAPAVVFLDLNMPRRNGFECLLEIKSIERLKQIPIIIFSTSIEQRVVDLLYENGAHYFIRKPADFEQYKMIIRQSLTSIEEGNISQPARDAFVRTANNVVV